MVVLVFWSLAAVLLPASYPDLSATAYVPMAAAATVRFFASSLVHELSCRRRRFSGASDTQLTWG